MDEEKETQLLINNIIIGLRTLKTKDPIEYYTSLPEMKKDLGIEFFNEHIRPKLES